jgi:hypothetical protein
MTPDLLALSGLEAAPPPRTWASDHEPAPRMISIWRMIDAQAAGDLLQEPGQIEAFLDEEGPELDLEHAWHGLHYLLAGSARETAGPRGALLGGHRLGEVNVGFGPARLLSCAEVAAFDDLLQCISEADLRARFDAQALMRADIYPNDWDGQRAGNPDPCAWLRAHFRNLKAFVAAARRDEMALVTYLA